MKCILIATTSLVAASTAFAQQADQDATTYNTDETLQTEMEAQRDDANAWDATGSDRPPYTDDHDLIDAAVYGAGDEHLGNVERVRLSADGEVEAIVVEHGGVLEIGGAERLIEAGQYTVDHTEGDARIQVAYSEASFETLPEFDEDLASDYPLSSTDQVGDAATVGEFDEERDGDEYEVGEDLDDDDEYDVAEGIADEDDAYERDTAGGDDVFDQSRAPFTDDHELVDTEVIGADGTELGEVERVRFSNTGEIDAIIVEHGGALDVGGREVLIEASDYSMASIDGESRIRLTHDEAAFLALPDFDERQASDYPLSSEEAAAEPFEGEEDTAARDMTDDGDNDWEVAEETREASEDLEREARTAWNDADQSVGQFTDDHDLIGNDVYGSDGRRLGEVERVRVSGVGEVETVIVKHGGIFGIGSREIPVEAGHYSLATVDGDTQVRLDYDEASFKALPDFDEDEATGEDRVGALDERMSEDPAVPAAGDRYAAQATTDDELEMAQSEAATQSESRAQMNDMDMDRDDNPYADDHELIDTEVYGSAGANLGEVERVRFSSAGDIDAIVVETGGVADVGGREVLVEASDYSLATIDGETRITVTYDQAGFDALPDFDERLASDYPLSSDEFADDEEVDMGDGSR